MKQSEFSNGNRLDALKKREAEIKAKIAVEQVKRKRREWKEYERLKTVIGGVLLASASKHPDFELMLKSTLAAAEITESEKKLLRERGWI